VGHISKTHSFLWHWNGKEIIILIVLFLLGRLGLELDDEVDDEVG
jgi:hypothetical protein